MYTLGWQTAHPPRGTYLSMASMLNPCYPLCIDVTTVDLDNLAAETCAYMTIIHPDYSKLAARILVSNLHKQTTDNFLEVSQRLKDFKDKVGRPAPMLAEDVYAVIEKNID